MDYINLPIVFEVINTIILSLTNLIEKIGYGGVALSMFIESFFVPIPSELILPFAGFLSSIGKMNLILVIFISGVASYLGSLPFYFIGLLGNRIGVENFLKKYGKYLLIPKEEVDKAYTGFNQKGNIIVLVGRVIPIIRSVISLPAGIAKMNFIQFSIYTLLGSTVWSSLLILGGYFAGSNWEVISGLIEKYQNVVIVAIIGLVLGYFYVLLKRRNK